MWPWQVYLRGPNFFCGGSLITSKWIISAAHCCHSTLTPSNYTVYAGAYNLSGANSHEVKVKVKNFIINPNYTTFTKGSDICLMELQTELNFTQYISPVCLPASGVAFPTGLPCWVTGWGNIARNVSLPPPKTLQEVLVPLIGAQVCKSYYSRVANITDNMICAGYVSGGKGICQGDSGGPLVCAQADRWYLVGIVSFGIPCEQKYYPSVYGRSNAFVDWITTLVPE
ncbi:hypothetical protein XENTR_v10023386, partial [Xenopus tropicalis]